VAAGAIDELTRLLARVPGLGPRSSRRAVLALLERPDTLGRPLLAALRRCLEEVRRCTACGNLDTTEPCRICADPARDGRLVLVVEDVEDLWAMERSACFSGRYHVLGGTLSALRGIGPDELHLDALIARIAAERVAEVVLALGATVDGQTTAHYLTQRLRPTGCAVTRLAHGVPVGGELNYLDEGTLTAALRARQPVA
jgi:recombination protein RecR